MVIDVGEHGARVHPAIAVRVFQQRDAALRWIRRVRVTAIFGDEKPAAFIKSQRARRPHERLRRDEFHAQRGIGQLERFQRVAGRKLRVCGSGKSEHGKDGWAHPGRVQSCVSESNRRVPGRAGRIGWYRHAAIILAAAVWQKDVWQKDEGEGIAGKAAQQGASPAG